MVLQQWTEPASEESQEPKEEYFETRSSYSDTFSDFSHDTDECFQTPLSSEAGSCAGGHLESPKHSLGSGEQDPSCGEEHLVSSEDPRWKTEHPIPSQATEKLDVVPLASDCSGMNLDVQGRDEVCTSLTNLSEEAGLPPVSQDCCKREPEQISESLKVTCLEPPDSEMCLQVSQLDLTGVTVEELDGVGSEPTPVAGKLSIGSEHGRQDSVFPHLHKDAFEYLRSQQDSDESSKHYELPQSSEDCIFHPEDLTSSQENRCRACQNPDSNEGRLSEEASPVCLPASVEGVSSLSHSCVLPVNNKHNVNKLSHTDHSELQSEKDSLSDSAYTPCHLQNAPPDHTEVSGEPNSKVSCHKSEQKFSKRTQYHAEEKFIVGPDSATFTSTRTTDIDTPFCSIPRTDAWNDNLKKSNETLPCSSTDYVKEFTVIPQKEQEVIYSDHSDYGVSRVMERVCFDCSQHPCPFEIVAQELVAAPVSPTDVCFELSDDLPTNCTHNNCELPNLSAVDEGVKKIPLYPKQCCSLPAKQLLEEDLRKSQAFERDSTEEQAVCIVNEATSDTHLQAWSDLDYQVESAEASFHHGAAPRTVRDDGSDTNNNIKTVISEHCRQTPCTFLCAALEQEHSRLGQLFSEGNVYCEDKYKNGDNANNCPSVVSETVLRTALEQEPLFDFNPCHSFPEEDNYCKHEVTNVSNRLASSSTAPQTVMLMGDKADIVSPLHLETSSSPEDSARNHICDYLIENDCQLHFSAVEQDQTAGVFQLKDVDVMSQGDSAGLYPSASSHTDGQHSPHGLITGEFKASERVRPEYPEILREESLLLLSCTLKDTKDQAVENSERSFDTDLLESAHAAHMSEPMQAQSGKIETYPFTDISVGTLSVTNLEPIMETDHSQEGPLMLEKESGLEIQKEVVLSGLENSFEKESISAEGTADFFLPNGCTSIKNEMLGNVSSVKRVCFATDRPEDGNSVIALANGNAVSVSPDLDLISMNSEEAEDSIQSYMGTSCCAQGPVKNKENRNNLAGKGSRFSMFSRIPSFRKAKREPKGGNKVETEVKASSEDAEERNELKCHSSLKRNRAHPSLQRVHMSHSTDHLSKYSDHTNDDIFEKAFALTWRNLEKCEQSRSMLITKQVGQHSRYGDILHFKSSPMIEGFSQKRSKSSDNLNLRLKLAMANKSLSNLFEIGSSKKERQQQVQNEDTKTRKNMKLAKDTEMLKRTYSVPASISTKSTGDRVASLAQKGVEPLEKVLRNMRHSDPISKKPASIQDAGVEPEMDSDESPVSNGLSPESDQTSVEAFEAEEEEESFCAPIHPTVFALANQLSPSWARSLGSFEGLDTPMRPMSPKPQSPGLWGHRRSFRYPSRSVASSLCSLGQGQSMEGLSDPPQRTNTFRARVGQLASAHSFDTEYLIEDSSSDSQSQTSLVSTNSGNESEVSKSFLPLYNQAKVKLNSILITLCAIMHAFLGPQNHCDFCAKA